MNVMTEVQICLSRRSEIYSEHNRLDVYILHAQPIAPLSAYFYHVYRYIFYNYIIYIVIIFIYIIIYFIRFFKNSDPTR